MERNLNIIKKMSQEKEEENMEFRIFLKGYNPHEVDNLIHQLYKKYSKKIDCTKCGNCCKKLTPALSLEEVEQIAEYLGLSYQDFEDKYIKRKTAAGILIKGINCPFLEENKCSIYNYRPEPCRSYPHLHKNNIVHRLFNLMDNSSICPIVYNVLEDLKNSLWTENSI